MIDSLVAFTNELSRYIIPVLLVGIPFYGLAVKKVKVYESFVEGAFWLARRLNRPGRSPVGLRPWADFHICLFCF